MHAAEAVVLQPHVVLVLGPELDGALARDDVGERVEPFAWDVDALRSVTSASVRAVCYSSPESFKESVKPYSCKFVALPIFGWT